jgi:hypothetical protein
VGAFNPRALERRQNCKSRLVKAISPAQSHAHQDPLAQRRFLERQWNRAQVEVFGSIGGCVLVSALYAYGFMSVKFFPLDCRLSQDLISRPGYSFARPNPIWRTHF